MRLQNLILPVAAVAALSALAGAAVIAAESGIDAVHSTLVATFRQEGVPVDAPFRRFSGVIHFDPARPAAGSASLDVQAASFDLGDAAYNSEVAGAAWLASSKFPQATFRSTSLKATGPGRLEAAGALTVKGKSLNITVPITQSGKGAQATFDGAFTISRKAFGIGDPEWEGVLEDAVVVKFHLVGASL